MLDLLIAHDLIQRQAKDRFETSARAEGKVQGAEQNEQPRHDTVSLRRLPFGRSLTRMRRLIARRRSTTPTAAGC